MLPRSLADLDCLQFKSDWFQHSLDHLQINQIFNVFILNQKLEDGKRDYEYSRFGWSNISLKASCGAKQSPDEFITSSACQPYAEKHLKTWLSGDVWAEWVMDPSPNQLILQSAWISIDSVHVSVCMGLTQLSMKASPALYIFLACHILFDTVLLLFHLYITVQKW